jgi:Protein of unknown function (DUF3987)
MSASKGVLPDPSEPDYTVQVFPPRSKANGAGMTSDSASAYAPEPWPTVAPAAFHGLAGEVVSTILPHTESDPVALLLQYLASFGNVIGRNRYYQAEDTQHFGNLFVTLVGDTSKARKGTSAERIRTIFKAVDLTWASERMKGGVSSGEGIISQVRDEVRGMRKGIEEIVDAGAGDHRFLLMLHEFSQALVVLKREGNTLSQVLRDAWDGRERLETLTKHAPTKASNACISIIAHITVEELRAKLDETAMANGFANRLLFACVRRSKLLPFGGALAAEVAQRLGEQTKEAIIAAQLTTGVTMNAPAQALWREVYPELARGGDGLLAHITSRAEAQTVRLALLYTLLDRAEAIDAVHLEAALAVWRYCEASAHYIFGDLLGDPAADTILQTLRRRKPAGMAKREIIDLFGRHLRTAAINAALGLLERTGKVRCEQQPQASGAGRPREMWFAQ